MAAAVEAEAGVAAVAPPAIADALRLAKPLESHAARPFWPGCFFVCPSASNESGDLNSTRRVGIGTD